MMKVFDFVKFMLANFILGEYEYSNDNSEFINLLLCGKTMNNLMKTVHIMRGKFKCGEVINFDKERKKLLHCITFDEALSLKETVFFELHLWDIMPVILPNLKKIIVHNQYNYILESKLVPINLTELVFGDDYEHTIKPGDLPSGLIKLVFGEKFNQEIIHGLLPPNLLDLEFAGTFAKFNF